MKHKSSLVAVSQFPVKRETDSDVIDRGAKVEDRCSSHGFLGLMPPLHTPLVCGVLWDPQINASASMLLDCR